eukprot:TRINITY_DN4232_c0_g1_i28.p1 TRINITY_DN4232_c0_g1~~TRINITY_DN4232_c0_g1_i28.p1  ORF type:complete len:104 (+),score=23.14 TRINITY_DN4232_c0_g1_i28:124-435(+)
MNSDVVTTKRNTIFPVFFGLLDKKSDDSVTWKEYFFLLTSDGELGFYWEELKNVSDPPHPLKVESLNIYDLVGVVWLKEKGNSLRRQLEFRKFGKEDLHPRGT